MGAGPCVDLGKNARGTRPLRPARRNNGRKASDAVSVTEPTSPAAGEQTREPREWA